MVRSLDNGKLPDREDGKSITVAKSTDREVSVDNSQMSGYGVGEDAL